MVAGIQGTRFKVWLEDDTEETLGLLKSTLHGMTTYMIHGKQVFDKSIYVFVIFKTVKRLSAVKKLFEGVDWDLCVQKSSDIIETIRELDDVEELGVVPSTIAERTLGKSRLYWADVVRACKEGTVLDEYPREFFMYNDVCKQLK